MLPPDPMGLTGSDAAPIRRVLTALWRVAVLAVWIIYVLALAILAFVPTLFCFGILYSMNANPRASGEYGMALVPAWFVSILLGSLVHTSCWSRLSTYPRVERFLLALIGYLGFIWGVVLTIFAVINAVGAIIVNWKQGYFWGQTPSF